MKPDDDALLVFVEHNAPTADQGEPVRDLAPPIHRQRLVIEGYPERPITADEVADYLQQLSTCIDMTTILEPVTHRSDRFGWAGWIHWETSGAHFYAWEVPMLFFSVDIYACKAFDVLRAVELTEKYFQSSDIEWREF